MVEIKIHYHCERKVRLNDQHDYVHMTRRFLRGDGGNKLRATVQKQLCAYCYGNMVQGDATKLKGAKRP